MVKYLISLVLFVSTIILAAWNTIDFFVDIHSFLIVGILPFLFVSILFGFKEMCLAFSTAFRNNADKGQLVDAISFFKTYGKTIWITCLIATLIGIVQMLGFIGDNSAIGPNLALALISVLYTAIINVVIIIPFTIFLKRQLKEYGGFRVQ